MYNTTDEKLCNNKKGDTVDQSSSTHLLVAYTELLPNSQQNVNTVIYKQQPTCCMQVCSDICMWTSSAQIVNSFLS